MSSCSEPVQSKAMLNEPFCLCPLTKKKAVNYRYEPETVVILSTKKHKQMNEPPIYLSSWVTQLH